MKVKNKLNELTKDLYLRLKAKKYTDAQIKKMYRAGDHTFIRWKQQNGIPKNLDVRSWEHFEFLAPEEIERLKKKYEKYDAMGWTIDYIADEMGLTEMQLVKFRKKYFPERVRKERRFLTDEEAAAALSNGLSRKAVAQRRSKGWTLEQAISIPKGLGRNGRPPWENMIKTKNLKKRMAENEN